MGLFGLGNKIKKSTVVLVGTACILMLFYSTINTALIARENMNSTDVFKQELQENRLLYEAFQKSGARFKQLQVNGWTKINEEFTNEKEAAAYFRKGLEKIPVIGIMDVKEGSKLMESKGVLLEAQGLIDEKVILRLTMMTGNHNYYLVLSMAGGQTDSDKLLTTLEAAKLLASFPKAEKLDSIYKNTSLIYIGTLSGKVKKEKIRSLAVDSIDFLKSNMVETLVNERVVSVSGYTPMLAKWLTVDGKSVNINMAFRYNSVENLTMVYYATPVITSEY